MSEKLEVGKTEEGGFWVNADTGVIDRVFSERIAELEKSELHWKEEARRYCQDAEYYHEVTEGLKAENARLRRGVDNIKIRSYELGQKELHDMAWKLLEAGDATEKEHWADTAFWRE